MFWKLLFTAPLFFLATLPSTTNYSLQSYGFGSGGAANSTTGNYALEGITGELSGQTAATGNYNQKPGFIQTEQANVPKITLTNPSSYYDKLNFVIDTQNNPTDALYALQVCIGADWSGGICGGTTMYVQNDDTLSSSLVLADYQTYSAWGGASGQNMIGLAANTTYYVRAKATQGKYTESGYGPSSSAATVGQQISFCLFAGASCGSGNSTSFSSLLAGTPATSSPNLGVTFSTNADNGGNVYIYSTGKLQSTLVPSGTINSATANLSSVSSGYGAQVSSASGLTIQSPYNGAGNNVGAISTTINTLLSASSPVSSGSATIQLQAEAANVTPAATDYADTVTVIAAANF